MAKGFGHEKPKKGHQKRQKAYLNLITVLLRCPSGMEPAFLMVYQNLLDAGLVKMMGMVAMRLADEGDRESANFLINLANSLAEELGLLGHFSVEFMPFIGQMMLAMDSDGYPETAYRILQAYLEQDHLFIQRFRSWLTDRLLYDAAPDLALDYALVLTSFASVIAEFPLGDRAQNVEEAIACHQTALQVITRDTKPKLWGDTQKSLAIAYCNRIKGDQAENLEMAISCYEASLQVYTSEAFPQQSTELQKHLAALKRTRDELYQGGQTPDFLHQVLQLSRNSMGDRSAVYPLLQANLDKLDDNFADQFRCWATAKLSEEKGTETADAFVGIIGFSDLIQHFPLGDRANNLEIAIAGYEVVTTFFTREAFPTQWAMTQINLGTAYKNRIRGERADNLERSILAYQEALQILNRQEFPQEWAILQGNLAAAYSKRIRGKVAENLETAIRCCEASLEVFTHKAFPQEWAKQQHNLGNIYLDRILDERAENLEIAIELIESALQVLTYEAFPEQWANSQNTLAVAYEKRIRGDLAENLEKAIALYQAVLRVRTREAFPHDWAQTQMNLANAYRNQIGNNPVENLEKAIAHYQLALQVYTQQAFPEKWARTQNNLGMAYSKRIDDAEYQERAIAAYEAALQVYSQETFPQQWAMTQKNLGIVYSVRIAGNRAENLSVAMTAFQSASQILTRNDFPLLWARNQYNQSVAYCYQGNIDEAITCCRSALEFYQPNTFPVECFTTGRELGQVGVAAKRWDIAIEGYSLAINAVETTRTWTTSESRRQEILAQAIDVYHNIVFCCINAGQLEKAIEYVERSRSKRLVDLMASNDLYQSGEIPPEVKELLQRFEDLQQQIDQERSPNNSGNNRELMGVGTSTVDRASFQAYNEAIATLEAEKLQVWEQLRRFDPVLAGEIQVTPLKFADIQKLIDQPTTAILSFYTTNSDTHIFVLRQNKITLHTCTGQGVETLQNGIFQNWLMPYVSDRKTWESQNNTILSELSQRLQLPELISKHLEGIEELIIVPHLLLHQIPFAALPIVRENLTPPCPPSPLLAGDRSVSEELGERSKYLGDKFLIRYTPSCQILEFCHQRGNVETFNETSLQYGTVEDAEDNLPCASFEGEQIAQLCDIPQERRLIGSTQATCNNYRQLVQKIQVLHSCHHAQSRLDNPLESQLKLADGSITLGQLMTPGWRLPNLSDVFLSCCETNLGDPSITDDILTLSTGFLCAGARSVVSTLWSVDDLATALFSTFYYQQRQQIKSRPEALRQAQIKLRQLKKDDLAELSMQVTAKEKELIRERKNYPDGSAERVEWERDYKKYAGVARRINTIKKSPEEFPFSHPKFWAAFTCQGLK